MKTELTAAAAQKIGEKTSENLLTGMFSFVKKKYGEEQVFSKKVFQGYLDKAYSRLNDIRTLATGDTKVHVVGKDGIYVSVGVTYKDDEIDTGSVDNLLRIGNNILVFGSGGMGKSMMMRYFFLTSRHEGRHIPVFVELRKVAGQTPGSLSIVDLITTCMVGDYGAPINEEQLEYSLEYGSYLFLFDGLDEVPKELLEETTNKIQDFCAKYPKNACIVTSRETDVGAHLPSLLQTFQIVKSKPLSKAQAAELITRLVEPGEQREAFLKQLDDTLFEKHEDFAKNPLLLTMLFLTFAQSNSIPDHLDDFYASVFDALYDKHDSRNKGKYKRIFHCELLDKSAFKQIFAHFCFQTYFRNKHGFSHEELLDHLKKSINKYNAPCSPQDYLNDLRHSVCLMVKDGNEYHFSHRSFQAYFAAVYTIGMSDEQQKLFFSRQLFDDDNPLVWSESWYKKNDYYHLLYLMQPKRFGINILEEPLRTLMKRISESGAPDQDVYMLKLWFTSVEDINPPKINDICCFTVMSPNTIIPYNAFTLFYDLIANSKERVSISIVTSIQKQLHEINKEFHHLYRQPRIALWSTLDFEEIDRMPTLSQEEKDSFYRNLAQLEGIPTLRKEIETWLANLNRERALQEQATNEEEYLDSF